ncbi:MAG: hypothetical protein F6K17_01345 [Okeania sp. SIO3C4]|nr:hypothetical protein [Okeania sp. SIO3C4]
MVKVMKVIVDIEENYFFAHALANIEKIASGGNLDIGDVNSLVDAAKEAALNCDYIIPLESGNGKKETFENIKSLKKIVANLS